LTGPGREHTIPVSDRGSPAARCRARRAAREETPLSLPEPASPAPLSGAPGAAGPGPAPLRILLAEDSEDNRILVRSFLRDHRLDEAADGAAAVQMFTTGGHYDLVLMDVQMPVMDGLTATAAMRAWERERGAPPTPIVAFTAHGLPEEIKRSLDAGCNDHLTKPVRKATLVRAVERHARPAEPPEAKEGAIRVALDESLRDLAPGYLDNRRADLPRLAAALAGGDWETLRVVGHNVKGTGAGYGFEEISRIGAALEQAAKASDAAGAAAVVDELTRYLGAVVLEFGGAPAPGQP
jgi:CheY-like chemotaxis protein/HPt (histidine-containing phosphotransfer) domain-containing protein